MFVSVLGCVWRVSLRLTDVSWLLTMCYFCFTPGPSFLESHPVHQYPLTLFGFVGVHSSRKGGLRRWAESHLCALSSTRGIHSKQRNRLSPGSPFIMGLIGQNYQGDGGGAQVRGEGQAVEYVYFRHISLCQNIKSWIFSSEPNKLLPWLFKSQGRASFSVHCTVCSCSLRILSDILGWFGHFSQTRITRMITFWLKDVVIDEVVHDW